MLSVCHVFLNPECHCFQIHFWWFVESLFHPLRKLLSSKSKQHCLSQTLRFYVLYNPNLYFQVPFATILERHSHSGLKCTALHTEKHVIHRTFSSTKTQLQSRRSHSVDHILWPTGDGRDKSSSFNIDEAIFDSFTLCGWAVIVFFCLLGAVTIFCRSLRRENVNHMLQWNPVAVYACKVLWFVSHQGKKAHMFVIFDISNAEDLRTVTRGWQESSSFPMKTEEACGASLQIITSVIKIVVAMLLFGLWIL